MKINNTMIDKELRVKGSFIKLINSSFTERRLKFLGKNMKKFKMKVKDKTMKVTEEWITCKDGSKMRLCIFKPLNEVKDVPGVLWIHGGGYALGAPEQGKLYAKKFMEVSDCVVVAPDYCLSVHKPYPKALEDCYDALLWMRGNAEKLGIRDSQLMVGGDSAGGGLTAALTLYARDKKEVEIAFQMPLYPMIDDRMTNESAKDNNAPVWSSKSNYNAWKIYLGELFKTADVPYYAAPARAKDFKNLPPTMTFVGDLEPFRDETIRYVDELKKAGVETKFKLYKGCFHAFDQMCPSAKVSKDAFDFLKNAFKYATKNYYAEQKNYELK